ncbi:MAG TPA: lysophospholipid acyltransferase family protein [Micropepsaceae bacterium]|nr:lysophospholipid acyltransferase family protein [Micropepsaceae bacterium]
MPPGVEETFSYATAEDPALKRLLIRAIEGMTGRPYLKQLYDDHRANPVAGENFWAAALQRLELTLNYNEQALAGMPKTGSLVIVANHPFGVLDGVIISYLISRVRSDFLVLTNAVLYQAEEIRQHLLPIDFAETKEALSTNLKTANAAKAHLVHGGCLVIFPAGGASTTPTPWSREAVDAEWKNFTSRLIIGAKCPVLPVFFAGQNSRLFQIASHISLTLRLSLFFKEVYDKIGSTIHLRIGETIPFKDMAGLDRIQLMEFLRKKTYALGAGLPRDVRGRRPRYMNKANRQP